MTPRSFARWGQSGVWRPSFAHLAANPYFALESLALAAARSVDAGIWYPADDLSNCFQDAAGTVPCTAEGHPVGLVLDQQYRASGPELVSNGTFDANITGWTANIGTASHSVSVLRITDSAGGGARAVSSTTTVPGRTYSVRFDFIKQTSISGSIRVSTLPDGSTGGQILISTQTSSGSYRFEFVATTTTTTIAIVLGSAGVNSFADFDNISVREVLAQPNATIAGPELLTSPTWVPNGTNTVTPLGGNSFRLQTTAAGGGVIANASFPTVAGRYYEFTCEVRPENTLGSGVFLSVLNTSHSGTLVSSQQIAGGSAWVPVRCIVVAADSQEWAAVRIATSNGVGAFVDFRNASVRELPGYHATQPTAGNRPTLVRLANGRWGLNFNGSTLLTNTSLNTVGFGALIAASSIPSNHWGTLLATGNQVGGTAGLYLNHALSPVFAVRGGANNGTISRQVVSGANAVAQNTMSLFAISSRPASVDLYQNGALLGTAAANAATSVGGVVIGRLLSNTDYLVGSLAFAAACPQELPDPTRIAIERFAAAHAGAPYSA